MSNEGDELWAVYATDPGGVSGVGRAVFDFSLDTVEAVLRDAHERRRIETWEVEGLPHEQSREICGEFRDWQMELRQKTYKLSRCIWVMEDFQLRPGRKSSPQLLYPVMIAHQCDFWCYEIGFPLPMRQQPSTAMTYATNERLKRWGAWVKTEGGRDHRRDVMRHLALAVHKRLR